MKELNTVAQAIYDKKGFNILSLDLRDLPTLADFIIIAEGNIDRHLRAIASDIQNKLEEIGHTPVFVEGMRGGDWIVLDYGEIVVHLLLTEFRERYALEELWQQAEIVDLKIVIDTAKVSDEYE